MPTRGDYRRYPRPGQAKSKEGNAVKGFRMGINEPNPSHSPSVLIQLEKLYLNAERKTAAPPGRCLPLFLHTSEDEAVDVMNGLLTPFGG
ncbi:hypothetical protein CIB84_006273 [Bambusicola thoracicus]|uniref:Uncharacterized protein n=1 Tax=Bambusicola thoracicus TaxID=9083 RepID=A0A2P4T0T3_BAMTH|nr:hypothetical protein CIB84_006273 [Bambusicola thoracicus]